MKVLRNNNKVVIIATGNGGTCPRLLITAGQTNLVDDYHGRLKIKKCLIAKVFK